MFKIVKFDNKKYRTIFSDLDDCKYESIKDNIIKQCAFINDDDKCTSINNTKPNCVWDCIIYEEIK